jgi:hypothetical protein
MEACQTAAIRSSTDSDASVATGRASASALSPETGAGNAAGRDTAEPSYAKTGASNATGQAYASTAAPYNTELLLPPSRASASTATQKQAQATRRVRHTRAQPPNITLSCCCRRCCRSFFLHEPVTSQILPFSVTNRPVTVTRPPP